MADRTPASKESEPSEDQLFGRAIRHFGRGFAFSAAGKPREANEELASLQKLAAEKPLAELKINDANPLSKLAEIAVAMLEAEIYQKAKAFGLSASDSLRSGLWSASIVLFPKLCALRAT